MAKKQKFNPARVVLFISISNLIERINKVISVNDFLFFTYQESPRDKIRANAKNMQPGEGLIITPCHFPFGTFNVDGHGHDDSYYHEGQVLDHGHVLPGLALE